MKKKIEKDFKEVSDFFIMFCKSRFELDVEVKIRDTENEQRLGRINRKK